MYEFKYTRDGRYAVFKSVEGTLSILQPWTSAAAIQAGNAWNVLRVVASGSSFWFYINGILVWTGSDASLASGRVGLSAGMDATQTAGQGFWADYATLVAIGERPVDKVAPEQQKRNQTAVALGSPSPQQSP